MVSSFLSKNKFSSHNANTTYFLKRSVKIAKAERCRISLSRSSKSHAPAVGDLLSPAPIV